MNKPTKTTKVSFDYHECVEYIQDKYKCDIRDYAGQFNNHDRKDPLTVELVPYWDFWHFVLDQTEIHNGCYFYFSKDWSEDAEDWQKEIINMFFEEFGEEGEDDMELWVSW